MARKYWWHQELPMMDIWRDFKVLGRSFSPLLPHTNVKG
jgi:hypothetical protein